MMMTRPVRLLLNPFPLYFLLGKAREDYLSQWFCKCFLHPPPPASEWLFTLYFTPKPMNKVGVRGAAVVGGTSKQSWNPRRLLPEPCGRPTFPMGRAQARGKGRPEEW